MKKIIALFLFVVTLATLSLRAQTVAGNKTADFKVKGFHLDLRIQVMKPQALKDLALRLSKSGINTLVMEYEATFPFENHPLISNRYAYTKAEIADFVRYCSSLNMDVIPLQQSFGHVEYILRYERYAKLREDQKDYSQVNPIEERLARELFTDLFRELAEVHPSKYIHIGCDETRLLGFGAKSKAKVQKEGIGKLYGDYVALICDIVLKMGKTPVLWADIALKHPDALQYIPKGVVFVDWNYGWSLDKFGDHEKLMKSGFEIWGSPSLRSAPDSYNLTCWEKHFNNIRDFIPQARRLGYTGMIMTSWSTSGQYSYLNESGFDIIDLYAIRRVYPLSGFNILLDAFLKSVNSTEPLNIPAFMESYGREAYGLDKAQSASLWSALRAIPYQVSNGKVKESKLSISQLADSAQLVANVFRELKPLRNKADFDHFRLMADTRLQYLRYQVIEDRVNSALFTAAQRQGVLPDLQDVINETEKINRRYLDLNKAQFYKSELEQDNELRVVKMKLLYNRLAGKK